MFIKLDVKHAQKIGSGFQAYGPTLSKLFESKNIHEVTSAEQTNDMFYEFSSATRAAIIETNTGEFYVQPDGAGFSKVEAALIPSS